tara:strand:- start:86 stop:199 length:114 start_codon:yes stop_codon:yes gene_type:complete
VAVAVAVEEQLQVVQVNPLTQEELVEQVQQQKLQQVQ